MVTNRLIAALLATTAVTSTSTSAQQGQVSHSFRKHLHVEYGLQFLGASAYRTAVSPEVTDYVVAIRVAADPLVGFRTNLSATLNRSNRFSLAVYGLASTLERNRFYGFGNDAEPLQPTAYYRLEQLLVESGVAARIFWRGADNFLAISPFFRFWDTDGDVDPAHLDEDPNKVDDGGIVKNLQPYGVGQFRQVGLRLEARGGTAGPETNARSGFRFNLTATGSPKMLDSVDPTLSVLAHVGTFLRLPIPAEPMFLLHARGQRVFGQAPFQDAAYLGGRRTLKGFKKQQFAGDLSLLAGSELRVTTGQLRVLRRNVTFGPLALLDVGRVYLDGVSPDGWHVGFGGGFWFRDQSSGRQVNISLARGDIGPRFYVSIGTGIRP